MNKKITLILMLITLVIWSSSSVYASHPMVAPIPASNITAPTPPSSLLEGASCRLQNDQGTYYYIWGNLVGDGYANYFDPAVCGTPTYPFGIDSVEFVLTDYTPSGGSPPTWPLDVRVSIFTTGTDLCQGPQQLLCSEVFTIQQSEAGTSPITKALNQTCCVEGPFFVSLSLENGTDFQPNASQTFSNHADSCKAWAYWAGVWYNWSEVAVAFGGTWVGYPCLRVVGKTEHTACLPPWYNHKMHFPQLPDLIGWDVNATMPKILADDWQCSQTGWVTGIHFWGSWKDLDQDPTTDDFYTPMPYFLLSIHENIPADADTPWSRPGRQIWSWEGEIPGMPSEPPTMESWFDPNTGAWNCNDHIPYWQYDFDVANANPPADSFFQYKDQIYWLNISAMQIPEPYKWGWKNTTDHFMDDAVYTDNEPAGPWYPIVEPPRCNWFDVYFDGLGNAQDYGSTNYFGQGWYRYEYWTNMWFYDNPFTFERPKHIQLNFYIEPVGPQPTYQFAINWSTPEWDTLGMGRPPKPGEDEMLYIGRQVFEVIPGPNLIDFSLPYNPEWVSVDFVATDVMISGWMYHECVGTSLDLSFVITGHEGEPPLVCGDANNSGTVDVGDIVHLINYLYRGGAAPVPILCVGDANHDGTVDVGDIVHLINYLFRGGPAPDPNCCNPPWK
jgi:hypothetical protein